MQTIGYGRRAEEVTSTVAGTCAGSIGGISGEEYLLKGYLKMDCVLFLDINV